MPNIPIGVWPDDPFEPPPAVVDAAEAYRHALEVIAQETDSPHVREYCESILSSVAEMLAGVAAIVDELFPNEADADRFRQHVARTRGNA